LKSQLHITVERISGENLFGRIAKVVFRERSQGYGTRVAVCVSYDVPHAHKKRVMQGSLTARGSQRAIKAPPLAPHSTTNCFLKFAFTPSATSLETQAVQFPCHCSPAASDCARKSTV